MCVAGTGQRREAMEKKEQKAFYNFLQACDDFETLNYRY